LLEGDASRLRGDAVSAHANVLRDCAALCAEDLVAGFVVSDILPHGLDNTCEVAPKAGELWLAQTGRQPKDRRAAHQAGVNEVKGCRANSDQKLVVLRHRLLDLLEL
jgi:hypothetical protein